MDIETRIAHAETAATAIEADGYTARAWDNGDYVRVYIERMLSRGRRQEMGYIEITGDGRIDAGPMQRGKAGMRDRAAAATGLPC